MVHTPRVLLILENPESAPSLRAALESGRYRLEIASSVTAAVQRILIGGFEVLVTSPSSAASDDIAFVQYLRRIQPGLKAIILAPAPTPEDVVSALRAHAFACFCEPFDPLEIAQTVERAVAAANWRDGIWVLSGHPKWISLRVMPRLLTAERLVGFVGALVQGQGGNRHDPLVTAFGEILRNAMEHGAGLDPDKIVEVSAIRTAKAFVFHFRDPGPGFSLDDLPHAAVSNPPDDPTAHVEVRSAKGMRPGGFGILMASNLVDEVLYNETGNEVILIKYTS